jgi:hypothetical protein
MGYRLKLEKDEVSILFNKIDELQNKVANLQDFFVNKHLRTSTVLTEKGIKSSAKYAEKNMKNALILTSNQKELMWITAISKIKIDGHIAEFGVFEGHSINFLSKYLYPKEIFGFDSFFGLEQDFVLDCPKGIFNLNGVIPKVNENVKLIQGSFSKSLPIWLESNPGVFSFLNIDCDTYESTRTVLNLIGPSRIVSGTIILFDEYFGFFGWENCEFKAWKEYCKKNNVKYKYLALGHLQVLVEVL